MADEVSSAHTARDGFATALRAAFAARKVTLAWLQERLSARGNPVSTATLSYWRSGARHPEGAQSLAAIADIEELLHLPPRQLLDLLGPSVRIGPVGTARFPLAEAALEEAVKDVFLSLGAELPETARDVATHSVTDVGREGTAIHRSTRSLVQATVGTVTTIPYLEITPGQSAPAPEFRAVAGARIVALDSHRSGQVHGALFELERPLALAETGIFEWSVDFPPGYPDSRETGHGVSRLTRELLLWTRFHPDALPDWIEESEQLPDNTITTPLTLNGGTSILQTRRRWGPGMLVLQWGYGERS